MLAVALAVTAVVALAVGVSVTTASTKATTVKLLAQSNGQGNPQLQAIFDRFMQLQPRHQGRGDVSADRDDVRQHAAHAAAERQRPRRLLRDGAAHGGLQSVLPLAKAGYVADLAKRPWVKTLPLAPANRPFFWRRAG